jgi:hypothetical protein
MIQVERWIRPGRSSAGDFGCSAHQSTLPGADFGMQRRSHRKGSHKSKILDNSRKMKARLHSSRDMIVGTSVPIFMTVVILFIITDLPQ